MNNIDPVAVLLAEEHRGLEAVSYPTRIVAIGDAANPKWYALTVTGIESPHGTYDEAMAWALAYNRRRALTAPYGGKL